MDFNRSESICCSSTRNAAWPLVQLWTPQHCSGFIPTARSEMRCCWYHLPSRWGRIVDSVVGGSCIAHCHLPASVTKVGCDFMRYKRRILVQGALDSTSRISSELRDDVGWKQSLGWPAREHQSSGMTLDDIAPQDYLLFCVDAGYWLRCYLCWHSWNSFVSK